MSSARLYSRSVSHQGHSPSYCWDAVNKTLAYNHLSVTKDEMDDAFTFLRMVIQGQKDEFGAEARISAIFDCVVEQLKKQKLLPDDFEFIQDFEFLDGFEWEEDEGEVGEIVVIRHEQEGLGRKPSSRCSSRASTRSEMANRQHVFSHLLDSLSDDGIAALLDLRFGRAISLTEYLLFLDRMFGTMVSILESEAKEQTAESSKSRSSAREKRVKGPIERTWDRIRKITRNKEFEVPEVTARLRWLRAAAKAEQFRGDIFELFTACHDGWDYENGDETMPAKMLYFLLIMTPKSGRSLMKSLKEQRARGDAFFSALASTLYSFEKDTRSLRGSDEVIALSQSLWRCYFPAS